MGLLAKAGRTKTVVLLDASFNGVGSKPPGIDGRTILMTAARPDQYAGPLPRSAAPRPAFSYLVLGALRG